MVKSVKSTPNPAQYNLKSRKCLVIGDVMLDAYICGTAERISPEAPAAVIKVGSKSFTPGGAANVAAGIRALGAEATLVGVTGNDRAADILLDILKQDGVNYKGIADAGRMTTQKTRLVGNGSQIARFDEEDTHELDAGHEAEIIEICTAQIEKADIIVISDYKKGVCTTRLCRDVIERAGKASKPVVVDPKQYDWSRYSGAYLIAPNTAEFVSAAGFGLKTEFAQKAADGSIFDKAQFESHAQALMKKYNIQNVLITRSKDGMTLVGSAEICDYKTDAKEVFDVTGAGDTVIAALSVFLAGGAALGDAAYIANIAAGIAVGRQGSYAVTFRDIETSVGGKLVSCESIADAVCRWRKQNKTIVFTNGCFDIIHAGHISLLEKAKQFGDILIVGLNSDASVRRIKGDGRPINFDKDRAAILAAFEAVDAVVIFDEDTPARLIGSILPDVLVKGADYTEETVVGAEVVKSNGGRVELVELVGDMSTSNIIGKASPER